METLKKIVRVFFDIEKVHDLTHEDIIYFYNCSILKSLQRTLDYQREKNQDKLKEDSYEEDTVVRYYKYDPEDF